VRPLVSLVALKASDTLEVARPDKGIALRVRCAWHNTPQGFPQTPLADFVKLTVDGAEVSTSVVEKKRPNGTGLADAYRLLGVPDAAGGRHTATATVRELSTGKLSEQTIEYFV
jgi:hypothetical protein